jgi:membrane protease YdiL (CAAX protease family)
MSEPLDYPEPAFPDEPAPPRRRSLWLAWPLAIVAWLVIIGLAAGVVFFHSSPPPPPPAEAAPGEGGVTPMILEMQGRYVVGATSILPGEKERKQLYEQMKALNTGPVDQRLRFIILAGELAGPEEAQKQLKELEQRLAERNLTPTPQQAALMEILSRLYADYARGRLDAPSVKPEEREQLRASLGWFGELALTPKDGPNAAARAAVLASAQRTFGAVIGIVCWFLVLALAGLVGLGLLFIFLVSGQLRGGLACGVTPGGVYAETFAVWMALFLSLQLGAGYAAGHLAVPQYRFPLICETFFVSLLALAWPVLRGVPWRQVREDIGWTLGRRPVLEPFIGFACYAMTLPLLGVGLVITLLLMRYLGTVPDAGGGDNFDPAKLPAHPVVEFVAGGQWWDRIWLLVLGSVAAPIIEETMFRGVLYRHLREVSCWAGSFLSVVFSATVVSFLFAVIHPQGLVAVPLLMAMAYGFCLAREWRGTVIPCMVAHGVSNGVVMLFIMLAMGQ